MKKSNYSKISFALFIAFLAVIISHPIHAQVGIGTTSPDASAVLDIQSSSNDKGILIPRMTQAQRNSISSPATGLMIFQTDGNVGFYFYDGSSWESFGEVKTVNGNSPAADGNVTLTFLATQTGTQAQRAATASPTDGLVHIVTGDPTPSENDKVYIYSTGLASWTLSSGFTDTDEQDISGSSFTVATSALLIDIEDGSGQTLDLSALEELVNDTDPATNLGGASQGDLAYDTTDDELQVYDGSSWVPVSSSVVTPTLDQVTDVGSSTTNGIDVGSLTVNSAFTLPTATGTAGQYLTVSTTTSELVFATPAAVVTPTLDQVTDVGSSTTNGIDVGSLTVNSAFTLPTATGTAGQYLTVSTTTSELVFATPAAVVTPTLDQVTDVGSSTTNGIDVGSLTVNSAFTLPTATGTAGQYLTVSTTTSELVFATPAAVVTPTLDQVTDVGSTTTNSIEVGGATVTGDLTVNTNTTLEGNTTIGDTSSDDLTITARLDSDLIPKSDDSRSLGSSSLNFNTVNTLNVTSNAGMTVSSTAKLTLNTSATGTPTISLQQGGTEMAGIGSSTFFIGDSTSGNHYFFPQTGGSLGQVLAFTNTNTLELYSVDNLEQDTLDSVAKRGATTNEPLNINTMTVSTSINVMTNANLGTGTSTDTTVTIGDDSQDVLDIKADLRSNLSMDGDNLYDIGSLTKNVRNVYSRALVSNSDLSLNVSNTADDDIFFQQSGTTKAGVNSSTFYIGRDSNRYEFPQIAPATVNNQVLAYTATNSITFITIAGTTTPTLDQVTDVGSTTTNSIEVGGATVTGDLTVSVTTSLNGTTAIGDATTDDVTISARLDSDLIPKSDDSRSLGSSSLNFNTVNTLNVTSNSAMTVSSTGILTLSTSATGTPTISLQQGGTEMAGIGSSTFFIGDSTSGNQYFFPQETGTAGQVLTVSTTTSELVFASPAAVVTPTLDQVTDVGSTTTNSIEVGGATVTGDLTVSVTTSLNGTTAIGDATTDDVTISARLDSDLIPKSDDSRSLGSSSLNFNTVNTLNVTSNSAMTVSSTGILTLSTSATGTPTISLQQGGTEMAGIGSSTFFIGDSASGNQYFFPQETGTAGQVLTVSTTTSELVFASPAAVVTPTLDQVTDVGSTTTNSIEVGGATVTGDLTVSVTTSLNGTTAIGDATTDDVTISARLDSDLIPKSDDSRSLGSSSLNFNTVNTLNVTSNSAMTVSSTGILTLSTSATGTPTISLQQGGTEMAGIGSSTFFIGDSTSGNQYFFPQETGTAGQVLTVSTTTSELVFASPAAVVTPTLDQVTDVGSTTTNSIEVGGATVTGDLTVSVTTSLNGTTAIGDATTDDVTISARLDSDLIPKSDDSRSLGSSSLNFNTVNTLNVTSNSAMTVSSTGILTLSTSATGTPTISLQQGGTEMAGIGSSTFFIGDSASGNQYFFPQETGTAGQVLTVSTTTSELVFASPAAVVTPTLDQVTDVGSTTTNSIEVGGATVTGDLTVSVTTSLNGTTAIGDATTDDVTISARLDSDLIPKSDDSRSLGSSSLNFNTVNTLNVTSNSAMTVSSTGILTLSTSATGTPTISLQQGGTEMAGIGSSTFFIGDSTSGNQYFFPQETGTAGQVLTVSTTTSELVFTTIASLPTGTTTGTVLRYNPAASSWEETELLKVNPGGTFANNITVSNTLVPLSNKTIDLGKTSYEFSNVFSQKIETSENDLEFRTNGQSIYLKRDSDNLVIQDNTTAIAGANQNNVAVGLSTLNPSSSGAQENSAFGYSTLSSLTNGSFNTALGSQSLYNLTTGNGNVAIGYYALNDVATTSYNVGIGHQAGDFLTGSENIAIGTTALRRGNSSSSQNVAIGREAMAGTTTSGNDNVALGYRSIYNNTSGSRNVALGRQSLLDNTQGNGNVALGFRANQNNTEGNYNVSIGRDALETNTTGDENIAIGYQADVASNNLSNAVSIGSGAIVNSSNTIRLGNEDVTSLITSGTLTLDAITYPNITGTAGQVLTVSTTTSELVFTTIAGTTTPTLDQVTDVGSTTTNSIEVGGATVTGDLTVSVTTSLNGTTAIGDATSDDLTVTARLDSDLIPKTDNSRNLGSSSLNFDTVNTLNVTSNSAMTVSSTGILTLSTSATGTPTISLQQGGTEMAGIGSSTFFIGDSTSGNQYFFPQNTGIPGQVLTVSTTTSNLVFTSSGLLPAGSANGDIIHYSGTQWERTDELSVPFGGSGPILSNRSLDPRVDDTHDIGDASAIFSRGYFREINSGSGSVSLTFNTSATGTPTISFQQGGTEMAGIGSSTFFIGDSTSGNHYFFPSSTQTSTFSQVLTYDSSNASNTLYWSDFVLISPGSNDGAVLKWNNTSQRWVENTDIKLDDSAYSDDITLGASIIPRASNLSIGRASDRFENVYTNAINSNTSSLTISTSATGTPTISFQQGGTELAGIGSSTFFIGDSTSGDHYFFPQETGTAGQVLTVSSTTNQLVFTTSDSLPTGTTTGTVLRYNPATSSWEETELLKVNPGGSFANNITVSNTLVPITNNTLDLGKTSYEFSKIFSRNLTTATPSLTFSIDGDNIYFKLKDVSAGYGSIFLTSQTAEQNQQGVTVIGADSYLTTATSSNYNTAFGFKNLTNSSLIGSYNVILGSKNLTSLTSGNGNIAIGDSAAASLATGDNIIAIGRQALNASTDADNIGIGNDALLNNTSGSANLAIGKSALSSNTLYDNNIALGNRALIDNSSSNNTAVGKDALDFENTGGNNTAIGYAADINNSSIANSTVIGANATVTTSNTIRLGDSNVTSLITSGTLTLDGVTYPNATGTAGQVLTVSSTTSELVFTSIGALPSGTATGTTLRYNYGSSAWEETNVLTIAPGGAWGDKIAVRQSIIPQIDNSLDLGDSSYEFADVNTRNISTSTSSISINIDGFSAELYEDTNVLTLKNVEKFETASSSLTFELSGKSMHLKTTANENYEFNNYPNVSTGSRNTSFGSAALRPSAASYSTAIGYASLNASALSGNYNTAYGYYSSNQNTTGEKNTSIGSEAAKDNTTGSNNVTIGYRAAFDSSDIGSNNVIIGSESVPTTSTVGDQNVVIGATAEVAASINNAIAIGYGATNSNSNSIQLGNSSITSVETSGVVSATGFETTGTATITTLTVGDSSKYTLPAATGTAGQVLTVSSTTSELVFADVTSTYSPTYLLAQAVDNQSVTSTQYMTFQSPLASNGISITTSNTINLPSGKIYKLTAFVSATSSNSGARTMSYQFRTSGSYYGTQGRFAASQKESYPSNNVPATAIVDCTTAGAAIVLELNINMSQNVEGRSHVIVEEL